ncbi:phosphate uptake regulator PhoU [archaeon]|nr:phosphate uptake regulator PhoU [archaeon]
METRKLYMTGGSTYVVSLPKKWVKKSGLSKGDSVVVIEQEGSIIIEPGVVERGPKKISIDVTDVPSIDALERLIIAYYLVGFDTIEIKLNGEDNLDYKKGIRKILKFLIGVEIVEDIGNSMTMEILLDHKRMPTVEVLKRMHIINKSMLTDLVRAFDEGNLDLARDVIYREREIDRLYFLVVRQLKSAARYQEVSDKLGITHQRDSLGFRIVVKSFERIADHLEGILANYIKLAEIEKKPDMGEFSRLATRVLGVYDDAVSAMFNQDQKLLDRVFIEDKEIDKEHARLSNQLFESKKDVQSSLIEKKILDSIERISGYSTDIAEIAINMSVEVP